VLPSDARTRRRYISLPAGCHRFAQGRPNTRRAPASDTTFTAGAVGLLFVLASLGLPGLGNFIAEILILTGSFTASKILTGIAALGFIAATLYSLRIMQKVFYGPVLKKWEIADFGLREMIVMGSLAIVIIWLGLFPSSILNATQQMVRGVIEQVNITANMPQNANR